MTVAGKARVLIDTPVTYWANFDGFQSIRVHKKGEQDFYWIVTHDLKVKADGRASTMKTAISRAEAKLKARPNAKEPTDIRRGSGDVA